MLVSTATFISVVLLGNFYCAFLVDKSITVTFHIIKGTKIEEGFKDKGFLEGPNENVGDRKLSLGAKRSVGKAE